VSEVWLRMERQVEVIEKPPYSVPLMNEIEEIPLTGFKAVSTFSGCGGSCLGYRMAGFEVLWASEFVEAARNVYELNHPGVILDPRDIREVTPQDILDTIGLEEGELDLLDGSPPCAAFSTAGKREGGWGEVKKYSDTEQRVDDLFFEFARILRGLRPKTFVAENVTGLVKGVAKGYFKAIFKELKDCGYDVAAKVLDAQWLGVPQTRQRLIFVGVREDLKKIPAHPGPLPYRYTIGEALETLEQTANDKAFSKSLNPDTETYRFWSMVAPGRQLSEACERLTGKNSFITHVKLSPSKPSNTILQANAQVYHWAEARTPSIKELKRICAFPDDFKLVGSFEEQWERLGRAVPPVMMMHVAATIRDEVLT